MDLLDAIPSKGSRREEIFRFIRGLALAPATPGDYTDRDDTLRLRQVKIVGDYALTYWVDEPARTVLIVGARPADR